ncbi:MAG: hypothetical protein ACYSW3_25400 [Planctomycetota bacterium]|jgi:hypothetical protein
MEVDNPVLNSAVAALKSGKQPHFNAYVNSIVDYCIENENGKVFQDWDRETLEQLVAYHQAKGTLIALADDDAKIQGVFMWYNCDSDDQWSFVYNWDKDKPNGDAIFMAFLFASSKSAWKQMLLKFIEREPDCLCKKLLGVRERKGFPTRVEYTTKVFSKILKAKE